MAAIDPTAEPRVGDVKFATLRMYRRPLSDMLGEDEDDEDDEDREEDEEESEEEEEKPTKGGKAGKKAATTTDKMEIDELKSPKGKKVAERKDAKKDEESDEDDLGSDDDEEDDYENEFEGLVVCTLDNQRVYSPLPSPRSIRPRTN